ncbi:response regulator transcription factor [Shewanella nanhaiensis]|uniref:Response regulator transcription factor n=1 Tax=Shewanella nanhaiensis TaxID=2864872 RepID=A0ABS7E291_9GAMM|nr:response regulator transcription factor [Shewanella nanhaiensis]MBW8183132.1 response regulator transcription factor [Shewanella nanhaiensis]
MYDGEIFTPKLTENNLLLLKSTAGFLNLKVNQSKNLVTAWSNCQEKQKILLHFMSSVSNDIQNIEKSLLSDGFHIAICNKLSIEDEVSLIKLGFRASVSSDAPAHLLLETISKILKGNLYFSNEALSKFILNYQKQTLSEGQVLLITSTTKKEKEVLSLVCNGFSNEQVAHQLNVSINTIKMHMQNIYKKTNIRNRSHLLLAYNQGMEIN